MTPKEQNHEARLGGMHIVNSCAQFISLIFNVNVLRGVVLHSWLCPVCGRGVNVPGAETVLMTALITGEAAGLLYFSPCRCTGPETATPGSEALTRN